MLSGQEQRGWWSRCSATMKDLVAAAVQLIAINSLLLLVDVGGTDLDRGDLVPQLIGMLTKSCRL